MIIKVALVGMLLVLANVLSLESVYTRAVKILSPQQSQ